MTTTISIATTPLVALGFAPRGERTIRTIPSLSFLIFPQHDRGVSPPYQIVSVSHFVIEFSGTSLFRRTALESGISYNYNLIGNYRGGLISFLINRPFWNRARSISNSMYKIDSCCFSVQVSMTNLARVH